MRKHRRLNPFYHFRRGLEAAARGGLRAAERHLKRAIRLLPEDVMFRVELGKIQNRAGHVRKAERSYLKALGLTADDEQRLILELLLRQVRNGAA